MIYLITYIKQAIYLNIIVRKIYINFFENEKAAQTNLFLSQFLDPSKNTSILLS